MNIKEKIIHICGGYTADELQVETRTAAVEAEQRMSRLNMDAYRNGQRLIITRHYEYALSLSGEGKQTWIDRVWGMLEREFINMGGQVKK